MKKIIVRLQVHEYNDLYPYYEHRLIDNTEEALNGIREFINHMNTHWSGGTYSQDFKVLTDAEAKAFLRSRDIESSMVANTAEQLGFNEGEY